MSRIEEKEKIHCGSGLKIVISLVIFLSLFFTAFIHIQGPTVAYAQITGCGDVGDPGNADGVGKYCTAGGGQCTGTGSPICSADIQAGPGLCSKPCSTDADCGTGATCVASSLGSGCEPTICNVTPTPQTAVPTTSCLGAVCPTNVPTTAPVASVSPAPSSGGGGLSGLLNLLIGLILPIIMPILSPILQLLSLIGINL